MAGAGRRACGADPPAGPRRDGGRRARRRAAALIAALLLAPAPAAVSGPARGAEPRPWELTLLAGPAWVNDSSEIFLERHLGDTSAVFGAAAARTVLELTPRLQAAAEAQVARRTGGDGVTEVAGLGVARWRALEEPGLRLALGFGPSWAHRRGRSVADRDEELSDWLGLLMAEVSLAPRPTRPWSVVLRYQHSSSAFGLFGEHGPKDDGTALLLGITYRFRLRFGPTGRGAETAP